MEGIAILNPIETAQDAQTVTRQSFAASVEQSLQNYLAKLDDVEPSNLYELVLAEMEVPLLKTIMRYTNGNQSRAAKVLGLSRGTLRKKLAIYQEQL